MAHKKGQSSSRNGRTSNPKFRGVKMAAGQPVVSGNIIVRQVGTQIHAGANVGIGRDWTLFALKDGIVRFERLGADRKKVSVYPAGDARLTRVAATRNSRQVKAQAVSA